MWVFDGEQWTDDAADEEFARKSEAPLRIEEFIPELQVIEIGPAKGANVPPPPFP